MIARARAQSRDIIFISQAVRALPDSLTSKAAKRLAIFEKSVSGVCPLQSVVRYMSGMAHGSVKNSKISRP